MESKNEVKLKVGEEAARAVAFFADVIPFEVGEVISLSGEEELYVLLDIDPSYKVNHNGLFDPNKRIFLFKSKTKDGKGFYGRATQDFGNIPVVTDVVDVISFEEVMARMNKAAKTENDVVKIENNPEILDDRFLGVFRKNEAVSIDDVEKFLDSLTDIYIAKREVIEIEGADDFKALFGASKWDPFCGFFWWVKKADRFFIGKEGGKYRVFYSPFESINERIVSFNEVSVSYAIERQINIYKLRDNDKK